MEFNETGLQNLEPRKYKRKNAVATATVKKGDMVDTLDIVIDGLTKHRGRVAFYEDTEDGLQNFIDNSMKYLMYVRDLNNTDSDGYIIPDVESWAISLGISRRTLQMYYHRGGQWSETIDLVKDAIFSVKKSLAYKQKISPVVMIFDSKNNHDYCDEAKVTIANGNTETERLDEFRQKKIEERYSTDLLETVISESEDLKDE